MSLDDGADVDPEDVETAWRAEFRRRIDDVDSGKVALGGDESEARVHALLAELHR